MPHLEKMYTDFADKGFVVLSVSVNEARDVSKGNSFVKRSKFTFPMVNDMENKSYFLLSTNRSMSFVPTCQIQPGYK